jgi:hypothetical protein
MTSLVGRIGGGENAKITVIVDHCARWQWIQRPFRQPLLADGPWSIHGTPALLLRHCRFYILQYHHPQNRPVRLAVLVGGEGYAFRNSAQCSQCTEDPSSTYTGFSSSGKRSLIWFRSRCRISSTLRSNNTLGRFSRAWQ